MNLTSEPKNDPWGQAIHDHFFREIKDQTIQVFSSVSEKEEIPVKYLFRDYRSMPFLEKKALKICKGHVLDIGAGAGCHSLYLQKNHIQVTALERSKLAAQVIKDQLIMNVITGDFFQLKNNEKYDSLLLLMNGIGIVGKISRLQEFFQICRDYLKPGGYVILDSSDISYIFDEGENSDLIEMDWHNEYYGEVIYEIQYESIKSEPFHWLFIDFNTLSFHAEKNGFFISLIYKDQHHGYLACLQKK